jgi:signal peptidase I
VVQLDLVDGGQRHRCTIDLASGIAELAAAEGATDRVQTRVQGQGSWQLLFANVDDQLRLFVDDQLVSLEQPVVWETPFDEAAQRQPVLMAVVPGEDEPSDLAPAGISVTATDGPVDLSVSSLQVLRDGYYIGAVGVGRRGEIREKSVLAFPLEADQFFVLGDNSAASKDGRLWSDVYHVDRRLLIGRAVAIFWPHMVPAAWHVTVRLPKLGEVRLPSWPNFARMRPIR